MNEVMQLHYSNAKCLSCFVTIFYFFEKCNYHERAVFFHTHTPFALGIDMYLRPSLPIRFIPQHSFAG